MTISEDHIFVVNPVQNFVRRLQLPDIGWRGPAPPPPPIRYTVNSNEAFVVASQVNAFLPGVAGDFKQDINNCTLLAQLAAKKMSNSTKYMTGITRILRFSII